MTPSNERLEVMRNVVWDWWESIDDHREGPTDSEIDALIQTFADRAALSTQPRTIEEERKHFEADAMPYGFSLERSKNITGEPWCDYEDGPTGHRWAGWLASREPHQVPSTQPLQAWWRPISEAPKDGIYADGPNHYAEYILAWWPGALAVTRVRWWYRDDSDACNFLADGGYAVFPSVFQPLPPVPGQEGGA